MYLVPPRGRGGYKATTGFCNVQFGGVHFTPPKRPRYKPMQRDCPATLPPASLLVHYAVLLSMDLTYVTAAYAYGRPVHAQTNNLNEVIYYDERLGNDSLLPTLALKLAAIWALWQGTLTGHPGGLVGFRLDDLSGLLVG